MMVKSWLLCTVSALGLAAAPVAAQVAAQPISDQEAAVLRAQVAALRAQVTALEARLDAASPAPVAVAAPAPTPPVAPATEIAWRGAPELRSAGGWSFKPRGRLQIDVGGVDAPDAIGDRGLGYATEVRRMQVGVDGTIPGGFAYRFEADLADNALTLTDAYLTYTNGAIQVTAGHQKPPLSLDEATSDLFTSFNERAAFTQAFGFERRLGVSGAWTHGPFIVQGGVFADDVSALTNAANNSWSINGRIVFAPRLGATQLHLAASAHSRDLGDATATARYRTRPFFHGTDTRLVDTLAFAASGENNYGVEFAAIRGRFHAAGELAWMQARRPALIDPTFGGGYAEIGMFLTDDSRNYRKGAFDRVSPRHAVGSGGQNGGGMGAVELNLRYDWVDLNDASAGIIGGGQTSYLGSLTWIATPYVRVIASYGHISLSDARIAAGSERDYSADAVALRAQVDF
ncbi:MAG: porin [Pseudomonadota bacterium]